jgi:hypothetical protein
VANDAGGTSTIAASRSLVTADFFSTLGVAIRAGRPFSTTDSAGTRAAIINETLARQLGVTVGRQIRIGQRAYDVVGIVTDYASNPMQDGWRGRKCSCRPVDARDQCGSSF